jgi:PAS domain S-box-containing protein
MSAQSGSKPDTIRVLHIDEDSDFMATSKNMLEFFDPALRIEASPVYSPALDPQKLGCIDCILLDYKLPGMNGIELAKEIRKTSMIPIILYTGRGSENVAGEAFTAGIDDYIRKDVESTHYQVLAKRIRDAVDRKNAKDRYQSLLNGMVEGFQVIGFDYRYLFLNDAAVLHSHMSRERLLGHTMMEIYPGIETSEMFPYLRRCMEERLPLRMENKFTYPDGSMGWFELSFQPVAEGVSILSLDINHRKQIEDSLWESRSKLEALARHASRLTTCENVLDIAKVTLESIYEVMGAGVGSFGIVEKGEIKFIHEVGVDSKWRKELSLDGPGVTVKAVNLNEAQLIPDTRQVEGYIGSTKQNDIYLSELAVPITVDGRVQAVLNMESHEANAFSADDMRLVGLFAEHVASALQRIREEDTRRRYRIRLEELYRLTTRLEEALTIVEASEITADAAHSLFTADTVHVGLVHDGNLVLVPSRRYTSLVHVMSLDGRGIVVRAAVQGRTMLVNDIRKDPDYVKDRVDALSEVAVPLKIADRVVGILNIESTHLNAYSDDDVKLVEMLARSLSSTMRRIQLADEQRLALEMALREEAAAARAKELATVKTRFLSSATHEIRTPLTSIGGYTELIQMALKKGDTTNLQTYFEAVKRNTLRLTRLTDDLLDSQRIEEGRLVITRSPVKTSDLLNDLEREATPELTLRKQALEIIDELDSEISIDRDRIIQVLANLVNNASKFSPEGSTIHISVEKRGRGALFKIIDNGVGISESDLPKLFKPFPGIHVEGNLEGSGLGLCICRGIVELHGGRIKVESQGRGKGSTFSFTIPNAPKVKDQTNTPPT